MNRIRVLSDPVKRKIAAGEVVSGPSSVVKELMENALDAGSGSVDVEVEESGFRKILVRDDGCGIFRDDLALSIHEHATSKIRDDHDINSVATLGFRGEALSSISSISKLTILTRSIHEEIGGRLVAGGEKVEISDFAGAAGTTVIVENLFYNVPARKKFLGSPSAELRHLREIFLRLALACHHVSFSFTVDGKRKATLPAVDGREERIAQVYGKEALPGLYHESLRDIKVELSGFLSRPDCLKATRSMQLFFVNGRPIEYRYLGFLLSKGYEGVSMGRHPAAILFLTIQPDLVDVNVHPAKKEIRFFDQKYIDRMILHLCGKALGERIHAISPVPSSMPAAAVTAVELSPGDGGEDLFSGSEGGFATASLTHNAWPIPGDMPSRLGDTAGIYRETAAGRIRLFGIALERYILAEKDGGIIIVDFHAAHERILYDSIMKRGSPPEVQELIFPCVLELSIGGKEIVLEKGTLIREMGFVLEDQPDNSVLVRGVPALLKDSDPGIFLADLLETISRERCEGDTLRETLARKIACHSARRSGDGLSAGEMYGILEGILSGRHEMRCPHGRPLAYSLSDKDLERYFKR